MSREQFEQRMRARRAATCLAVARSAIASGRMEEAIERLEEACRLSPDLAEAQLLLEELRTPPEAAERHSYSEFPREASDAPVGHLDVPDVQVRRPDVLAHRSEPSGWSHWVAAAVAIFALATLAFLWPGKPSGQDGSVEPPRAVPVASPANEPLPAATGEAPAPGTMAQDQQPSVGLPSAVGTGGVQPGNPEGGADKGGVAIRVTEQPVIQRQMPMAPASRADASQATTATPDSRTNAPGAPAGTFDAERAVSPPSPSTAPATVAVDATAATNLSTVPDMPSLATPRPAPPLPPLQRVPVMEDAPAKPVATPSTETATAPVVRTKDVPAEASLRQAPSETGAIEGTLRRYADAYTRLDAAAARAVWPTVDQRALARAFEGLESQGIVFEHCDVAVAGDDATAACDGRAQYVPKVGSRQPLLERRQWVFRLRKADAGWQITQARAR